MTRLITALATVFLVTPISAAIASTQLDERVDSATAVLEKLTQIPEQGIPPTLLRNAYGVAVIPSVIKAGFWIGGSYGKGLLVVRKPNGGWSNPAFITLGAGSFGPQIGAQSSDIVLVFKSRKSVDRLTKGKLKLGGDANVAAGPVGRHTSAATDLRLQAEIYSYSRNRGLFAGISLEGAVISMDGKANYAFYGIGQGTTARILDDDYLPTPAHARQFIEVLTAKAPRLKSQGSRTADNSAASTGSAYSGARTYSIDDAPTLNSDASY